MPNNKIYSSYKGYILDIVGNFTFNWFFYLSISIKLIIIHNYIFFSNSILELTIDNTLL